MDNKQFDAMNELVDAIIAGERPPLERCSTEEELDMVRMAILLRGAQAAPAPPAQHFLDRLRDRMYSSAKDRKRRLGIGRRGIILSSAASLVVGLLGGLGLSRFFAQPQSAETPKTVAAETPSTYYPQQSRPLVTSPNARWVWVAAVADVHKGEALPFKAGALDGFLLYDKDKLVAISAICTHMGCHLRWNTESQDLTCPCHEAKFDIYGNVLSSYGRATLPQLPRPEIEVRDDGQVYVYTVS